MTGQARQNHRGGAEAKAASRASDRAEPRDVERARVWDSSGGARDKAYKAAATPRPSGFRAQGSGLLPSKHSTCTEAPTHSPTKGWGLRRQRPVSQLSGQRIDDGQGCGGGRGNAFAVVLKAFIS